MTMAIGKLLSWSVAKSDQLNWFDFATGIPVYDLFSELERGDGHDLEEYIFSEVVCDAPEDLLKDLEEVSGVRFSERQVNYLSRYISGDSYAAIGKEEGVSRERIRMVCAGALNRVRGRLNISQKAARSETEEIAMGTIGDFLSHYRSVAVKNPTLIGRC